ncbi:MAG: hypothetical protein IRY93_04415 [Chthoniobacterales bacterium]|nr:hypothetical protein [Chthoniobacterales bacterium]
MAKQMTTDGDAMNNRVSEQSVGASQEYVNVHIPEPLRYWFSHRRGYADYFDYLAPDRDRAKREKEQRIVQRWAAALYRNREQCPYVTIRPRDPPFPDCELIDKNGQKTGVEVTELVDEATIRRNKRSSYHWKEYSGDQLISVIGNRLAVKNGKLQRIYNAIERENYQRIIVIIHSDEPDLQSRVPFCRQLLSSHPFPEFNAIDEAWLLFPCPRKRTLNDVNAEFCQLVCIPIATPGEGLQSNPL